MAVVRTKAARVVVAVMLVVGVGAGVRASRVRAQSAVPENEAKAAFLYNFAKFVEWPEDALARSDFVVGVVGDDQFAAVMERVLHGKVVRDRPLIVRRVTRAGDLDGCHVVYVGDERQLPDVLQALVTRPVLTVGAREDFATQGGMIAFLVENQKLRFAVNLDAAERANLRISSQLLKLATRVLRREG